MAFEMNRFITIALLLLIGLFALDATGAKRPNVVFLLADDLGWKDIGCYGGKRCLIETPNINAIARRGLRFTDAHHIRHWADGGETKLENLTLLCRFHHRLVHDEGYTVHFPRGERLYFLDPKMRLIPDQPPPPPPTEEPYFFTEEDVTAAVVALGVV